MQVEITSKNNYFLHQSLSVRFAGYPINKLSASDLQQTLQLQFEQVLKRACHPAA